MSGFTGITSLVGAKNFKRHNPKSERFPVLGFHHVEFYCGDAQNHARRFGWGLGLKLVGKSDLSTGNYAYASYIMQSNDLTFVFTAPYGPSTPRPEGQEVLAPHPAFDQEFAFDFLKRHGLAVRAVAVKVGDAAEAFRKCVENGGEGVLEPTTLADKATGTTQVISEVRLYNGGDVVLRFISGSFSGPACCLAGYEAVEGPDVSYGLAKIDHIVGNVPELLSQVNHIMEMTGFHEFAEFTAEDVGTVDSGLNSMVLASDNERVLLPINEPTFGTRRKSQIQTYLEHNGGPGVQHLALQTPDIFHTMAELRKRAHVGGFDFMPRASDNYYKNLPNKIGDALTPDQYRLVEELGLLVDKDDQGVLVQVFTKPLGDRPTVFIEIIQRMGCDKDADGHKIEQTGGCGGFGKGNFSELFKSIEEYEKELDGTLRKSRAA